MSAASTAETYQPIGEPTTEALETCVGREFRADRGHARNHLSCMDTRNPAQETEYRHKLVRDSVLTRNQNHFFHYSRQLYRGRTG